jgi:cytochrome c biogenesis factor
MIAELGHFALITAFILSLAQGVLPLFGALSRRIFHLRLLPIIHIRPSR